MSRSGCARVFLASLSFVQFVSADVVVVDQEASFGFLQARRTKALASPLDIGVHLMQHQALVHLGNQDRSVLGEGLDTNESHGLDTIVLPVKEKELERSPHQSNKTDAATWVEPATATNGSNQSHIQVVRNADDGDKVFQRTAADVVGNGSIAGWLVTPDVDAVDQPAEANYTEKVLFWWSAIKPAISAPPPAYQHNFRFIRFFSRYFGRLEVAKGGKHGVAWHGIAQTEPMALPSVDDSQETNWLASPPTSAWFIYCVGTIFAVVVVAKLVADLLPVAFTEAQTLEFQKERGSYCWNVACIAMVAVLVLVTFWMSLMQVWMVNEDIAREPQQTEYLDGQPVTIIMLKIQNPGQRSFQAASGVALSAFIACATILSWRFAGQVSITTALLAQFAFRGGTLAISVAVVLEIFGSIALLMFGVTTSLGHMMLVGFAEEGAKLLAVILGVHLLAASLEQPDTDCVLKAMRVLVESPRGLMLAGLAVGYGFMVVENAEYLISSASVPGQETVMPGSQRNERVDGFAMQFFTFLTVAVRVFLNIHPWLAGISASRVAEVVFEERQQKLRVLVVDFLRAVWPCAVVHAAYDLAVVSVPVLSMLAPPLFWYLSRRQFSISWTCAEKAVDALK